MNDPFRMIPVRESPGRDCGARGRAGTIDFIAPGRGDAAAEYHIADALLDEVRSAPPTAGSIRAGSRPESPLPTAA